MIYRKQGRMSVGLSMLSLSLGPPARPSPARPWRSPAATTAQRSAPPGQTEGGGTHPPDWPATLRMAYDHGINFLELTQDTDLDALGRQVEAMPPPYPLWVQTGTGRAAPAPEAQVRHLTDYALLREDVRKALRGLRRERLDFLRLEITRPLLEREPELPVKLKLNTDGLKRDGLIRFSCAESGAGEYVCLRLIESGGFDALALTLNLADSAATRKVLPAARVAGMAVMARDPFLGGELFRMGAEVGLTDPARLAQAALRWVLAIPEVTTVLVALNDPGQLAQHLTLLHHPELTETDLALIETLRRSPSFATYAQQALQAFVDSP